jgi:hypothetical protein
VDTAVDNDFRVAADARNSTMAAASCNVPMRFIGDWFDKCSCPVRSTRRAAGLACP